MGHSKKTGLSIEMKQTLLFLVTIYAFPSTKSSAKNCNLFEPYQKKPWHLDMTENLKNIFKGYHENTRNNLKNVIQEKIPDILDELEKDIEDAYENESKNVCETLVDEIVIDKELYKELDIDNCRYGILRCLSNFVLINRKTNKNCRPEDNLHTVFQYCWSVAEQ